MTHARRRLQRIARLAAVGGLLCGGLMVTDAVATEPPATRAETFGGTTDNALGARLVSELGTSRTAGTWMGPDGRPVVAVTDSSAAAEVEEAGARAKVVRHSMGRLTSATEALRTAPRVPGTAWSVDYAGNKVVVEADSTVSADDWSRMSGLAEDIGGYVEMKRNKQPFTTKVNGAEPIVTNNGRCSAGFNVTDGRTNFILTAGHCGPAGTTWFRSGQSSQQVGTMTTSRFPGNDFALVQYQNNEVLSGPNIVNVGGGQGVQINGASDPFVGQKVFRSGSTTGVRSGQVTALNATVNYPEGTVVGLIKTTVCAEPGDSGGPLFANGLALGVTSGGDGDCGSGGTTFFQPVTRAMATLGVRLAGNTAAANGTAAGQLPVNPAAPGAAGTGTPPLVSGESNGTAVFGEISEYFGSRGIGPGIVVIVVSLVGLVATRSIWSAQDRRQFRDFYSQSWG